MDALWPNADFSSARNSLAKTIHHARYALEPGLSHGPYSTYIRLESDIIVLDREHVLIDVELFRQQAQEALMYADLGRFERAMATYRGELLPENRNAEWAVPPREELADLHTRLTLAFAAALEQQRQYPRAIEILQRVIQVNAAHEQAHRMLIHLYAASNNRYAALRQYRACVAALEHELGVEPDVETQAAYDAIAKPECTPAKRWEACRCSDSSAQEGASYPVPMRLQGSSAPSHQPSRAPVIFRAALIRRLAEAVEPVICITAGAGCGKSELLRSYIKGAPTSCIYHCLSEGDRDPVVFLHHLGSTFERFSSTPGTPAEQVECILSELSASVASTLTGRLDLIIDNAHCIADTESGSLLGMLLKDLPYGVRLITAARPPYALPGLRRRRVMGDVLDIRPGDLAFSREETGQIFTENGEAMNDPQSMERLWRTYAGWPIALGCAARMLSSDETNDVDSLPARLESYLAAYIREENLDEQPADLQRWLLDTALLPYISLPLCDAVLGRINVREMVHRTAELGPFLRMEEPNRWNYSPFFRDVVAEDARADGGRVQHIRGAALRYLLREDRVHEALLYSGEGTGSSSTEPFNLLGVRALSMLEDAVQSPDPEVRIQAATALASMGDDGTRLLKNLTRDSVADVRSAAVAVLECMRMSGARPLRIALLGPPTVERGETHLSARSFKRQKSLALLSYLACHAGHAVHREELADGLWPEIDLDVALNSLNVVVHDLRRGLEPYLLHPVDSTYIRHANDCYWLDWEHVIWLDTDVFEGAVCEARRSNGPSVLPAWEAAVRLYRGDLLQDLRYEESCLVERERLRNLFLEALEFLAMAQEEKGDVAAAIVSWQRLLALDTLNDAAHCRLLQIYVRQGARAAATRHFNAYRKLLAEELHLEPPQHILWLLGNQNVEAISHCKDGVSSAS